MKFGQTFVPLVVVVVLFLAPVLVSVAVPTPVTKTISGDINDDVVMLRFSS